MPPDLLSANTTLLQPGSAYFRLFNALWLLMLSTPQATGVSAQTVTLEHQCASLASSMADVNNQIDSLYGKINELNGQLYDLNAKLDNIHARLSAAGIA